MRAASSFSGGAHLQPPSSGRPLRTWPSRAPSQLRSPAPGEAARRRTAQTAVSAASGGSQNGAGPVAGRGDESQNGATPPLPPGVERPPRRQKHGGRRLSREDVHGGQYRMRQASDWVEPWITQDIPEDRLPRLEELIAPEAEGSASSSTPTSSAQAATGSGAWVKQPHHHSPAAMWEAIKAEAQAQLKKEPGLAGFVHSVILMHADGGLGRALASLLANKLASRTLLPTQLASLFLQAYSEDEDLLEAACADLHAWLERDAACTSFTQPLLFFKGFQALQAYRLAHWLWLHDRKNLAVALQNRVTEVLHVDIHPGAAIGRGVLIDHATGVVVGETAVIGDGVSLLHRVTLGGSGVRDGKRHPTIGNGVLLGAAVSVLGPVTVGATAKVGAGSVVTSDLPPACVAVGVPARIIKTNHVPPKEMDQCDDFNLDYVI